MTKKYGNNQLLSTIDWNKTIDQTSKQGKTQIKEFIS